jgi:hypothetical protein
MMTTLKITRIWIEHINKIEVTEAKKYDELGFGSSEMTIWTTKGDKFELILQADTVEQLAFKKPDESWLTPKVYKGKSMHEEEEA